MIKIKDNGEKLVDIKQYCPSIVIKMREKRKAFVRESVAKMLKEALEYLPEGMTFIIRDAWRPVEVQKKIYRRFYNRFKKQYPTWGEKQILNEVDKFAAPYKGKEISGHMTGGAIDIRLYKNGRKVPMVSSKLSFEENAKSVQSKLPRYIKKNRKIMFNALSKAGLSNYPKEYWHWSYGDLWWAKRNKKSSAIYGKVDK